MYYIINVAILLAWLVTMMSFIISGTIPDIGPGWSTLVVGWGPTMVVVREYFHRRKPR